MGSIIHIGLPKTGSTALQDYVFANTSRTYIGKVGNSYKNQDEKTLIESILYQSRFSYCSDRQKMLLGRLAGGEGHEGSGILVSDEAFSVEGYMEQTVMAERLNELFPGSLIMIVIRAQHDLCESMFLHYLRSSGERRIRFDQWLEYSYGGNGKMPYRVNLDYSVLIKRYIRVFGRQSVRVIPYELLFKHRSMDLEALRSRGIQIGDQFMNELLLGTANTRQTKKLQAVIDIQNQLPIPISLAKASRLLLPGRIRTSLHRWIHSGESFESDFQRDLLSADKIRDLCCNANAWIAKEYSLPLKELGYSVPDN